MARPSSKDPLDKFRWSVSIDGFTRLGFTQCDVPSMSIKTQTYAEGGNHLTAKKIVDSVEYKPVTLLRGVTSDESFHAWARQFMEVHRGRIDEVELFVAEASSTSEDATFAPLSYRRDVKISHLNREGQVVKIYTLINAFPIEYEPASSFSSDGDDVLSMEKLTLTYESFSVKSISNDNNPKDPRDIAKRLVRRSF